MRTLSITATPRSRQRAGARERLREGLRIVWCLLGLLATAADVWLTALLGLAPFIPRLRRLAAVVADECRTCAAGAIDADVIEDCEGEVWR